MAEYQYYRNDVNVHYGRSSDISEEEAEALHNSGAEYSIGVFNNSDLIWSANVKGSSDGFLFSRFYENGKCVRSYSWYGVGEIMQLRGFSSWAYTSFSDAEWSEKLWASFSESGDGTIRKVVNGKGEVGKRPWKVPSDKFEIPPLKFPRWDFFKNGAYLTDGEIGLDEMHA